MIDVAVIEQRRDRDDVEDSSARPVFARQRRRRGRSIPAEWRAWLAESAAWLIVEPRIYAELTW